MYGILFSQTPSRIPNNAIENCQNNKMGNNITRTVDRTQAICWVVALTTTGLTSHSSIIMISVLNEIKLFLATLSPSTSRYQHAGKNELVKMCHKRNVWKVRGIALSVGGGPVVDLVSAAHLQTRCSSHQFIGRTAKLTSILIKRSY